MSLSLGITVDNISVTYNNARLALYDASCQVQPGRITGLVGPNGGGKSTLFKSIMGFLNPTQGRVYIDGLSIEKAQRKQLMAYVHQLEEHRPLIAFVGCQSRRRNESN